MATYSVIAELPTSANGSAATYLGYSGFHTFIAEANPKIRMNSFPFPGDKGLDVIVTGVMELKGSPNPEAARAFINFAMKGRELQVLNRVNGSISLADLQKGNLPSFMSVSPPPRDSGGSSCLHLLTRYRPG